MRGFLKNAVFFPLNIFSVFKKDVIFLLSMPSYSFLFQRRKQGLRSFPMDENRGFPPNGNGMF